MAIMKNQQHLYDLFETFLERCIIKGGSLFDESPDVFTISNFDMCMNKFVDDFKDDKRNYQEKINEQFEGTSDDVKLLFAHANWLWAFSVNDMTSAGKRKAVEICVPDKKIPAKSGPLSLFPDKGFGNAGSFHKQNKYWEVVANLKVLKWLKADPGLSSIAALKNRIEEMALFAKYAEPDSPESEWQTDLQKIEKSCAMFNILLYLCKPERYERIASENHKRKIVESFGSLHDDTGDHSMNTDEQIFAIRKYITTYQPDFDFYRSAAIRDLWNPYLSDAEYSEIQGLTFKKNIILYGPPGTGKTHTAGILARSFICQKIIEHDKTKVKDYIQGNLDVETRIKTLQLHSNYAYEDFIAGIHLVDGKTVYNKGYFYSLCEDIEKDPDKSPYVLILDEINRVDLSRLFGEAFSAIEYREKNIDLAIGKYKLKVPENLYIIGTMNEIDFSLERLDFALRRRFIWFFYGFDPDALYSMIEDKKEKVKKLNNDDVELFIEKAIELNKQVSDIDELGKQYQIGHTFFAEITAIAAQFAGRKGYINKISLFKENGPLETLWNISLEPLLDAFFGNLDEPRKNEHLKEMKKMLLHGKK